MCTGLARDRVAVGGSFLVYIDFVILGVLTSIVDNGLQQAGIEQLFLAGFELRTQRIHIMDLCDQVLDRCVLHLGLVQLSRYVAASLCALVRFGGVY